MLSRRRSGFYKLGLTHAWCWFQGERARALGIAERVIWLTRTSDADIARLLRAGDLYVQASHVETGPLVVVEAMAVLLPVVGTICGSMPDFIVRGVSGELVPRGTPQALGDAITGALCDTERRREMGVQGRKRVQRRREYSQDRGDPCRGRRTNLKSQKLGRRTSGIIA
jgi:glycosyltransferase involved in cell wall biosynthesis